MSAARGFGCKSSHTPHATRHTSHVTRHTPHATRHMPHATRHTPHATRHTSHATRHTSHVTRHTPQFACRSSSVTSASDSGPSGIFGTSTWRVCLSRFAVPKQYSKPLAIPLMFTKSTLCLIIRLFAFFIKSLDTLHLASSNRVYITSIAVALGAYHTAAISTITSAVYTWGDNSKGQVLPPPAALCSTCF